MALHGASKHYRVADVKRRHFAETAKKCGVVNMDAIFDETLATVPRALDEVGSALPRGFPEKVYEAIAGGVRKMIERGSTRGSGRCGGWRSGSR